VKAYIVNKLKLSFKSIFNQKFHRYYFYKLHMKKKC